MKTRLFGLLAAALIALPFAQAFADEYSDTIKVFRDAGESGKFFAASYGYAVFPTVGKGGIVVGAAHGSGRVYRQGKYVGDTSMTQITVGAQATAVAITAGASAQAGTTVASAGAGGTPQAAETSGKYYTGIACFPCPTSGG